VETSSASGQYFEGNPSVASSRQEIELVLPDQQFELITDTGVFSRGRVDSGTKLLLLDGPSPCPGDKNLVDLGAGYGPIATVLAARNPNALVWAVDINERARQLCVENATNNGLDNVNVVGPNDIPDGLVVDRVWSNPPIRVGKTVLHELLRTWLLRLTHTGTAHLVVQKHLGSDSLQKWLTTQGWPTIRRASRAGYRLLDVSASEVSNAFTPEADS